MHHFKFSFNEVCIAVALGVGAYMIAVVFLSTGTFINYDGISYISAAESLFTGGAMIDIHGEPFLHWPPGMPLVLIPAFLLQIPVGEYFHHLNAVLYGGAVAITYGIFRSLGILRSVAAFFAALLLISPQFIEIYSGMFSEPLFIFFLCLYTYALIAYMREPSWRRLVLLAAGCALMTITRYAGIVFIAAGLCFVFLDRTQRVQSRIQKASVFSAIAFMPLAVWFLRNKLLFGALQDRTIALNPFDAVSGSSAALLIVSLCVALYLILALRPHEEPYGRQRAACHSMAVLLLIAMAYTLFIASVHYFIDMVTLFDTRQLIPVAYYVYLSVVVIGFHVCIQTVPPPARLMVYGVITLCIALYIGVGVFEARREHVWAAGQRRYIASFHEQEEKLFPLILNRKVYSDRDSTQWLYYVWHIRSKPAPPGLWPPHTVRKDVMAQQSLAVQEDLSRGAVLLYRPADGHGELLMKVLPMVEWDRLWHNSVWQLLAAKSYDI